MEGEVRLQDSGCGVTSQVVIKRWAREAKMRSTVTTTNSSQDHDVLVTRLGGKVRHDQKGHGN